MRRLLLPLALIALVSGCGKAPATTAANGKAPDFSHAAPNQGTANARAVIEALLRGFPKARGLANALNAIPAVCDQNLAASGSASFAFNGSNEFSFDLSGPDGGAATGSLHFTHEGIEVLSATSATSIAGHAGASGHGVLISGPVTFFETYEGTYSLLVDAPDQIILSYDVAGFQPHTLIDTGNETYVAGSTFVANVTTGNCIP